MSKLTSDVCTFNGERREDLPAIRWRRWARDGDGAGRRRHRIDNWQIADQSGPPERLNFL